MSAPNIQWSHRNVTANGNGVARAGCPDGGAGSRVLAFGGFATGTEETGSSTDPDESTPATPIVGTLLEYDASADRTLGTVFFAAPPGTYLRIHVWSLIA